MNNRTEQYIWITFGTETKNEPINYLSLIHISISESVSLAGTLLSILPLLVMYLIFQRQFVESIESTGITGE